MAATTLDLLGPWPTTCITSGSATKASMTGCGSAVLTTMSMSFAVSRRRRRLPHTSARITPGIAWIFSNSAVPSGSAEEARQLRRPLLGANSATKKVDGLVSAGNTGAVVAAGLFLRKFLKGIRKPGIAALMPTRRGGR